MLGAKSHWLGWRSPSKTFNDYGVLWEEDKIIISFNGKDVRRITDSKTLDQLKGTTMNVLINNWIQKEYIETDMPTSEMIIKHFKYIKS